MLVDWKGYIFFLIALICILWSNHEIWTFNGDSKKKKKGCLCGLTEALALCHPLWREVSGWMIRHGHFIAHKFLMILPKPASGKKADKQPLSRASRKETPRWGLFPSDLYLGSLGCLSREKGRISQTLNVWLLCQRPWRPHINRLQNNTLY